MRNAFANALSYQWIMTNRDEENNEHCFKIVYSVLLDFGREVLAPRFS